MNLYVTIRWGHADSPEGPDGEDTNFLIRALTVVEAGQLTDEILATLPVSSPNSARPVQPFCHQVIEMGQDVSTENEARVLIGPWIGRALWGRASYRTWVRDEQTDNWQDVRDVFGE